MYAGGRFPRQRLRVADTPRREHLDDRRRRHERGHRDRARERRFLSHGESDLRERRRLGRECNRNDQVHDLPAQLLPLEALPEVRERDLGDRLGGAKLLGLETCDEQGGHPVAVPRTMRMGPTPAVRRRRLLVSATLGTWRSVERFGGEGGNPSTEHRPRAGFWPPRAGFFARRVGN
jgi:hypothetical protein